MSSFEAYAAAIGVVTGATVGVITLGGILFRWSKPLREMAQDWAGQPARPEDGVEAIPGVMRQLRNLRDAVHGLDIRVQRVEVQGAEVRTQVSVNGGQSMRDAVNRIESTVNEQAGR